MSQTPNEDKSVQSQGPIHYPLWFGGSASCFAACVRLQTQAHDGPRKGMAQMGTHILKESGVKGLYRGLSASLLRQITYSTTRFGVYEELKEVFTTAKEQPSFPALVAMASTSGFLGGIAGTPADILNVRMQNDAGLPAADRRNYKHAFDGLARMSREEGFGSLFRGVWPNSMRAVLMTASQLASYDVFKRQLLLKFNMGDNLATHFSASLMAGFVATTICSPVDVIKTRVMSAKTKESLVPLLTRIMANEGFGWMFKGWVPSFIRLGPHTIVTFMFLEQHKKIYRKLRGHAVASDTRPPNGPADGHTSFNDRREEHRKKDSGTAKSEQEEQTGNGEGPNEHRRPRTKSHLRDKRRNQVPEPPPIPDWFLRHNVKLVRDSPGLAVNEGHGQVVRCVDAETGHTLFEVPYYEAWPSSQHEGQKERKDAKEQKEQKAAFKQKVFFDQRVKFEEKQEQPQDKDFEPKESKSEDDWQRNQMRWIFMEAEASARAAFCMPPPNQRSHSFLSSRVDLSLQCPDSNSHDQMDELVRDLARVVQADVVRLDANDFAELADEFVGMGQDGPGSYSHLGYDVFEDYAANSVSSKVAPMGRSSEPDEEDEMDEDEEGEDDQDESRRHTQGTPFASVADINRAIMSTSSGFPGIRNRIVGIGITVPQTDSGTNFFSPQPRSSPRPFQESGRDEARMAALLDTLMDAPQQKAQSEPQTDPSRRPERRLGAQKNRDEGSDGAYRRLLRYWRANPALWLPQAARSLVVYLSTALRENETTKPVFRLKTSAPRGNVQTASTAKVDRRTIVHVRELRDIANSRLGESIIQQLCKVVQKRRRANEKIMVIGTTAQDTLGPLHMPGDLSHTYDFPLRSISVPPFFNLSVSEESELEAVSPSLPSGNLEKPAYGRILEINIRHVQSMLRKLTAADDVDMIGEIHGQLNMPGMQFLAERVLTLDQVQRLALIAIGLSKSHAKSDHVQPIHLALAGFVVTRSDHAVRAWSDFNEKKQEKQIKIGLGKPGPSVAPVQGSSEARLDRIKKGCNAHETRLLSGVVDPTNIKTTFSEVHAQIDTINALKDLTTLSLLRPEAFKYGVLANDRLPGLLLYGPPGTGKTLLAKAVAKESKATVLEVSGAQIYEKYVGEGEKMVRAVFSLAKKLSPCVVFIDEADAIFGSRSNSGGNRNTHREIINQFLREWDGMDDHGVFMMVASNRPFDLDDAVLRRLPRRLLVDLPVAQDRESILGIHLKHEAVDPAVSLAKLAEQTPLYSGSDLKNLSVAAALACVREENELASQHKDEADFNLPEKRTLLPRHFDKALAEISASISEDMSSLAAVRKFDEQYGDRKGRRKKTNYGFGLRGDAVDENAVRVRSVSQTPPPPPPPSP